MTLGLDLTESRCKVARASEHLNTLDGEAVFASYQAGPYKGRLGQADPEGWYPILIKRNEIPQVTQQRLSVLVGDTLHNLRSALDYIVAGLVTVSGIPIETVHQFPISDDPKDYADQIWRKGDQVGRYQLRGVKFGLVEIESLQPYYTQPDPEINPLWTVNRFSNHDKHRSMTSQYNVLGFGSPGNPRGLQMGFGDMKDHVIDWKPFPQGTGMRTER